MATDARRVVHIWSDLTFDEEAIPKDFTDTLQVIYRKHGWPDAGRYRKEVCLVELMKVQDEKYPDHHSFYRWWPE